MRVAYNDYDDRAGLRGYVQFNNYTHTHTHTQDDRAGLRGYVQFNKYTHTKEAGGRAQGAQGSSKICTSRESVSPLSRLIRGFRNKYH